MFHISFRNWKPKSKYLYVPAAKNYIFSIKMFFRTNKFLLNLPWKKIYLLSSFLLNYSQRSTCQFEKDVVVDGKWSPERRGERISCNEKYIPVFPCHTQHLSSYQGLTTTHNLTSDEVPRVSKIQGKIGLVLQEKSQSFV